jgi:hypothetical protein
MSDLLLTCWLGASVACLGSWAVGQQNRADVVVGFRGEADLFDCLPGDKVRLESDGPRKTMRWDVNYAGRQYRLCAKEVVPERLVGMSAMTFACRADGRHQLWVQLNEQSGEVFYQIITVNRDWKQFDLRLADLTINKDKVVDGRLDVSQINKIVVLDFAALSGKVTGGRTIWLADWRFTSQADRPAKEPPSHARKLATGKLGMVCVPRDFRETEAGWRDLFTKANEAGVQVLSLQAGSWSKAEKAPGVYEFPSWDRFFTILDKSGFEFESSKDIGGPFFLDKVDVPPDIRFVSFADAGLLSRYKQFVTPAPTPVPALTLTAS